MKAVLVDTPGDASHLKIGEAEKPKYEGSEPFALVKVHATALNRADILQREGKYPPPPGDSTILGLEMAGTIEEVYNTSEFVKGERVCALLGGGGYAEYALVPVKMLIRIPESISFEEAAAFPEAYLTAYQALFWNADLLNYEAEHQRSGKSLNVLVHAGASGVGTALIQLLKRQKNNNTKVLITAGSEDKIEFCKRYGADIGINYKTQNFAEVVLAETHNVGAHIIIGGPYWKQNLTSAAVDSTIILLGFLSGPIIPQGDADLSPILRKRITFRGSTLRARSLDYKERLTSSLTKDCLHLLTSKLEAKKEREDQNHLILVVDSIFSWKQVKEAHEYMEQNRNKGKIVLRID